MINPIRSAIRESNAATVRVSGLAARYGVADVTGDVFVHNSLQPKDHVNMLLDHVPSSLAGTWEVEQRDDGLFVTAEIASDLYLHLLRERFIGLSAGYRVIQASMIFGETTDIGGGVVGSLVRSFSGTGHDLEYSGMSVWESNGASNEWYTPKYVFDALSCRFDLDVAHPENHKTHVPCDQFYASGSLKLEWQGFIWMNPPFGGRNGLVPWLDKFFSHGNGIALTPDGSSAPWWQDAAAKSHEVMFVSPKIKFERPDGSTGNSPGNGTTLFAVGNDGIAALRRAEQNGLGLILTKGAA